MNRAQKAPRHNFSKRILRRLQIFFLAPVFLLFIARDTFAIDSSPAITVVTTTGMIADIAVNIGGADVSVSSLMGPGVDPHLYRATQGDLKRLLDADLILFNGLHLEGKMAEILEKLSKQKPCIAVTRDIRRESLLMPPEFEGNFDPHIWFDVKLWIEASKTVLEALSSVDETKRPVFTERSEEYLSKLKALDRWVESEVAKIPVESRILITAHDAFGYFGRAYNIEVMGLQGVSTATEYGLYDVKRIIDVIISRRVKAIFIESSVPRKFVLSVQEGAQARGYDVSVGGELFSDAMGEIGTSEGTYIGMVEHNVRTIVNALK